MKKITKLFSILLTVVLAVSTVLSVPFATSAKEDPMNLVPLWADEYAYYASASDFVLASGGQKAGTYPMDGVYSQSSHNQVGIRAGAGIKARFSDANISKILPTFSELQKYGFLNPYNDDNSSSSSRGLPYVTYTVIAPEDGTYTFEYMYDYGYDTGSAIPSGGYFVTYDVNDKAFYKGKATTSEATVHDKFQFNLVKGVNFIRVITHVKDFANAAIWIDQHAAWVDPKLSGIKANQMSVINMTELRKDTNTKYVYWPARDANSPNNLADTNWASGWTKNDKSQYNTIDHNDFVNVGYDMSTESTSSGTKNIYKTKAGTIPFCSKTLYVPVAGYYQLEFKFNLDSNDPHTAFEDAFIPLFISDPETGKYKKYKKFMRHLGGSSVANISVYLTEGENVVTITPPYASSGFGWININSIRIVGIPKTTQNALASQRDPSKITTLDGSSDPVYNPSTTTSSYIYASSHATLTGIEKNYKELVVSSNANRITPSGANKSGTGVVGNLANIFEVTDMQTVESMQSEGYLNKTHLPIVTYHVDVATAGTYELEAVYEASVRENYSYNDQFIVVSANDKQFEKAYFTHTSTANCECCTNYGANYGSFPNGGAIYPSGYSVGHHSISKVKVDLEAGRNIIRCILAVGETAPMTRWVDFEAIRLSGPGSVTAVAKSEVGVDTVSQALLHHYQSSNFTETDANGNSMASYVGSKKVSGHAHNIWPTYGLYDKTLFVGELDHFSSMSIKVKAPANGYYDMGIMFRYSGQIKGEKYKHAMFVDGVKHFYYAQDNTSYIYKNMMNLSVYLTAGEHTIAITTPTDYDYVFRVKTSECWADMGKIFLYGGLTYVGKPSHIDQVRQVPVNKGRLEAEYFAFANEINETMQLNSTASGGMCVGGGEYDRLAAVQSFENLTKYFDASNNRYVSFMVEAPADGTYTITPGYYLHVADTRYYLSVLVNGKNSYKVYHKKRPDAKNQDTMIAKINSTSVDVSLVKGVNTITLIQAVEGMNERTFSSASYLNFDYLDIDERLTGIPIHHIYDGNGWDNKSTTTTQNLNYMKTTDFVFSSGSNITITDPNNKQQTLKTSNSAANVVTIHPGNSNVAYKGYYSGDDHLMSGNAPTGKPAWIIMGEWYNGSTHALKDVNSIKANSVTYSQLATGSNASDTKGVPYVSFKVKAPKNGYYNILAFLRHDDNVVRYYDKNQPYYVSALIDGQPQAVGFEVNSGGFHEFDDSIAGTAHYRNRLLVTPYLTEGEHVITLTAPLKTDNPIGSYSTFGEYAYKVYYGQIHLLGGLTQVNSKPSTADLSKVSPVVQNGSFDGKVTDDQEAFYTSRGGASSAALALKNDYQFNSTFEDSTAVDNLVSTAVKTIQNTEYAGVGGSYSFNGKTYTDYNEFFDAIIEKLKADIIAQKTSEFNTYKSGKLTATLNAIEARTDISAAQKDQIETIVRDMFDTTTYDPSLPVTSSVKKIDAIYEQVTGNIQQMINDYNDFEAYRIICRDTKAPAVQVTKDPHGINADYHEPIAVINAIEKAQQDINTYVYNFGLDADQSKTTLQENKEELEKILAQLDADAQLHREARYYQTGTWVQYQVASEVKEKGQAYIRLFFEIDMKNNAYNDFGFMFSFKDENYSIPMDPLKMSLRENAIDAIKAQTDRDENGELIEKFYYPYEYDRKSTATHFVFVYFVIPVEMFSIDYTFQAYVEDANGHFYYGKEKVLSLDTYKNYVNAGIVPSK